MIRYMRRLTRTGDDTGASAVEYGLLVAAVAALVILVVFALGGLVQKSFKQTCSDLATKSQPGVAVPADCTTP